jgi:hypothetical protein
LFFFVFLVFFYNIFWFVFLFFANTHCHLICFFFCSDLFGRAGRASTIFKTVSLPLPWQHCLQKNRVLAIHRHLRFWHPYFWTSFTKNLGFFRLPKL